MKGRPRVERGALLQGIRDFSWPSLSRYLTTSVPYAPADKAGAVLTPKTLLARARLGSVHSIHFVKFAYFFSAVDVAMSASFHSP